MTRPPKRIEVALALAAALAALAVRVLPSNDLVFSPDGEVRLVGADSYFHMRTVDNLLANFPHRSGFDPYMVYPGGQNVPTGPLFDWTLAGAAWALGLGSPSEHLVDLVGAWTPAVMGALVSLCVFVLGAVVFNPSAGVAAAWLAALLPGLFYEVTRIGFPDHHAAEALLYVACWAALAAAVAADSPRRRTLRAAGAGLLLGAFLLNRPAGAFLAGFFALWAVLECWRRHAAGRPSAGVWQIVMLMLGLAAVLFIPGGGMIWSEITLLILGGGALAVSAAAALAVWLPPGAPRRQYPVGLAGLGLLGVAAVFTLAPGAAETLRATLARLATSNTTLTIRELYPLLIDLSTGAWSLKPGYEHFALSFFLFPPIALWIGWRSRRVEESNLRLLTFLNIAFFLATLVQHRMAIYLAVNMAITVGYGVWRLTSAPSRRTVRIGVLALTLLLVYAPNVPLLLAKARLDTGPSKDWLRALDWVRRNTPEPLGSPEAYFRGYPRLAPGETFAYPSTAYSIMLWWDYGYWLQRIGRRIPVANGTQAGARFAARFFTETDPAEAARLLAESDSRYVIADPSLPLWLHRNVNAGNAKFRAMLVWAGRDASRYFTNYLQIKEGKPEFVTVFTPEYYRTMLSRLFLFNADAFEPTKSTWVISYEERSTNGGFTYRRIRSMRDFPTYEKARRYIDLRPDQTLVLAGLDPVRSCVPLDALDDYREAYRSSSDRLIVATGMRAVKVFEYRPDGFGDAAASEQDHD